MPLIKQREVLPSLNQRKILKDLLDMLTVIKHQNFKIDKFQPLVINDIIISLPLAQTLLDAFVDQSKHNTYDYIQKNGSTTVYKTDFMELAAIFLKERWSRIQNTPLCYSLNTENPMNWFCIQLTKLMHGSIKNSALMPTVAEEDFVGQSIDELELGSFIIDDKATHFIHIATCIEYAVTFFLNDGERHLKTIFGESVRKLTFSEYNKLLPFLRRIDNIYNSIPHTNLLIALQQLSRGLRLGSTRGSGTEHYAGQIAHVAIANFFLYYESLNDEEKNEICRIKSGTTSLEDIMEVLFRKDTGSGMLGVEHCVGVIRYYVDNFINHNQAALRAIPIDINRDVLINNVKAANKQLDTCYPLLPSADCFPNTYSFASFPIESSNKMKHFCFIA